MITLSDMIQDRAVNWDSNGGYNQDAMPEIFAHYKDYIATGKFPYTRMVAEDFIARHNISEVLIREVGREVFLASHQLDRERAKQRADKLEMEGWKPLTKEAAIQLRGKQVKVNAMFDGAFALKQIEGHYKIVESQYGIGLMTSRQRTKGIMLQNLNAPFFQEVNK